MSKADEIRARREEWKRCAAEGHRHDQTESCQQIADYKLGQDIADLLAENAKLRTALTEIFHWGTSIPLGMSGEAYDRDANRRMRIHARQALEDGAAS